MKRIAVTISLVISLLLISGCSVVSSKDKTVKTPIKKDRIIVITSAVPSKVLPAFTTFSWNDQYSDVLSASSAAQANKVRDYIRSELIAFLKTKGYQYLPEQAKADVTIGFLFALKDSAVTKALKAKFGLLPVLNKQQASRPKYGKGSLLLTVLDSSLTKIYWRSALLGFNGLEKEVDLESPRQMQVLLDSMMGGFPKAGR